MSTTTVTTDNPLREGLRLERVPHPCAMVIFGATGDLTRRKLVPALYNLAIEGLLPPGFSVVGYARRPWSDDEFRQHLREGVDQFSRRRPVEPGVWDPFAQGISYIQGEFEDTSDFKRLAGALDQLDRDRGTAGNRIYYLATPPTEYEII